MPPDTSTAVKPFSDLDWENLITFIQEGRVIPIIGNQLSLVEDPDSGEELLFDQWLARQLANKFPSIVIAPTANLNAVVMAVLQSGTTKLPGLLATLKRIIAGHSFKTPEALALLSEIGNFRLFLTTAIDPLLEQALTTTDRRPASVLCYGPKRMDDVPLSSDMLAERAVYHLFGRPDSPSGGSICEEDMIEWLTGFQSRTHSPEKLSALMESNHLLLIGLGFTGWLARFFLRAAKRQPLHDERDSQEYLADPAALADSDLLLFLRTMSKTTLLLEGTSSSIDFVRELHRRWKEAEQTDASSKTRGRITSPIRFLPPEREMPTGVVFISYSRSDLDFAKRLKGRCDARGIPTWFDMDRLEPGDSYEQKIRSNIENCSFFIPVISEQALAREEAFFYLEWDWAITRKRKMAPGSIFMLPVIIDEMKRSHPRIPQAFADLDIPVFEDGDIPDAFLDHLERLFNES